MTEDEARQKWCPMTQFRPAGQDPLLSAINEPNMLCIASDCVAWRATDNEFFAENPTSYADCVAQGGKPAGYCGLAGKP